MKTTNLVIGFVVLVCVLIGCSSREGEGSCVWCPDNVSDDVYDYDTVDDDAVVDNDIWPDAGPPDTPTGEVLTAAEACGPYLGVWDCECVDGGCTLGHHTFYLIELMQINGNGTWTFYISQIGVPTGVWTLTCDPRDMPPTDYTYTVFEITAPNQATITFDDPTDPDWGYVLQCKYHPT